MPPRILALLLLTVSASEVLAQDGQCRVRLDRVGGIGGQNEYPGGATRWYANGGVRASCIGRPIQMESDSFAAFSDLRRADMFRSVRFVDSTITLTADRAFYYWSDERLEAFGNVVLTNRVTGFALRGPNLTYYRAARAIRDSSEMLAMGRPTVTYQTDGDSTSQWTIVADRVRFRGQTETWMGGNVTIDRESVHASADSAQMNNATGQGLLLGSARLESRGDAGYRLTGSEISFRTTGTSISWVQARDSADATSTQWALSSDTVEFHLENDEVQAAGAWGPGRALAQSETYGIVADSLSIDMPAQVLTEIRGYRNALARADSSETADWMAGDTLVARFASVDSGRRYLERLEAVGSARAFYRIPDAQPGRPAAINYSRGLRLTATFDEVGVRRVDVVGEADGIYLEPAGSVTEQ